MTPKMQFSTFYLKIALILKFNLKKKSKFAFKQSISLQNKLFWSSYPKNNPQNVHMYIAEQRSFYGFQNCE